MKRAVDFLHRARSAIAIATVLVLLAVWPVTHSLVSFWLSISDYAFGLPAAVLSLVWLSIVAWRMGNATIRPVPVAIPLLLIVLTIYVAMQIAASNIAQQLLVPVIIGLTILAGAGVRAACVSAVPLASLYLALPWWDFLVPALQHVTVVVTEGLLALLGIPAKVFATTISIPEGSFEVAEGCAGKRYFIVAVTLSIFAGAFCRLSWRGRVLLTASAAALALIANWLRVIIVVVAGHLSNMQHYLVAKEHLTLGTIIFGVLVLGLTLVAQRLARKFSQPGNIAQPVEVSDVAPRTSHAWYAVSLLLLGIPAAAHCYLLRNTDTGAVRLAALPMLLQPWQGPMPPDTSWLPRFTGNADQARVSYWSSDGKVEIYAVVFGAQSDGHELISYQNSLLAPGGCRTESDSDLQVVGGAAASDKLRLKFANCDAQRWAVAYLYRTGGHTLFTEGATQLAYGFLELIGAPASGMLAMAARCDIDCDQATNLLRKFWQQYGNKLVAAIPNSYSSSQP